VNTEALLRHTVHPPCSQEQEILEIAVPVNRRQLKITDRLSLRIGLWLMLRAERSAQKPPAAPSREEIVRMLSAQRAAGITRFTERETLAIFTQDMQRHMW
jgi:hypothetical protein